jgi:hypothetical protein
VRSAGDGAAVVVLVAGRIVVERHHLESPFHVACEVVAAEPEALRDGFHEF